MSDTPRTDRVLKNCNGWHHVPIELARELERELNAANERIKQLDEAGDAMKASGYFGGWADAVNKWIKVRDAKP